jgi:hypothetical protein
VAENHAHQQTRPPANTAALAPPDFAGLAAYGNGSADIAFDF